MTAELDEVEAKKARKAAKRAAAEAAETATPAVEDADDDAGLEAKKLRKAAKRAAAAAAAEEELLLEEAEAKKKRKAAKAAAMDATAAPDAEANTNASGDHFLRMAEAKRARKLAKRSAAKVPADGGNDEVDKHKIAKRSAAEAPAEGGNDEVDKQHLSRKQRKLELDLAAADKDNRAKLLSKGNKELEVVVSGLSPATASTVVRRDFAECGEIVDFRMPLNDEGGHKGMAFIEYKDASSCEQALKLGGKEYDGRFLVVRMATDTSGKGKGKHASKEFEVFVGGLPWDVTEERVRKDFSECGQILALRMPLTKSGLFQGTAFIVFADKDATDKAIKFNGTDYGGRYLDVRMNSDAPPPKDKGSNGKAGKGSNELEVFVGGLPGTTTEHDLKEVFAKCGEIVTLKMPPARETDTKRIAFIKFKEKDACGEALKFSETMMGGLRINVRMSGSGGGKGKTKDGKGKGKGKKGKK